MPPVSLFGTLRCNRRPETPDAPIETSAPTDSPGSCCSAVLCPAVTDTHHIVDGLRTAHVTRAYNRIRIILWLRELENKLRHVRPAARVAAVLARQGHGITHGWHRRCSLPTDTTHALSPAHRRNVRQAPAYIWLPQRYSPWDHKVTRETSRGDRQCQA